MPVIHARPVISGTTAGRAADLDLLDEPAGEARADHRLVDERPRRAPSSPRACSCAMRALVPVPHGERSSQPGWIARRVARRARRRGPARGRRRGGSRRCARRRDARASGIVDRGHDRAPRLDQLAGARRVDLEPDGGGRRRSRRSCRRRPCRRRPRRRRRRCDLRRARAGTTGTLRIVTAVGAPVRRPPRAPRPARPGVSRRTTVSGSVHLDHAGLDEHGGHADRAVPAHRQAAGDLDEEHAPVGVVARRRLQDRARHRGVPARLAHQQQAQVVAARASKCSLRSSIVAPGQRRRRRR